MLAAGLARHGHQDIHKLLGFNRRLRFGEQLVLNMLLQEHMDAEFTPLDLASLLTGSPTSERESDD